MAGSHAIGYQSTGYNLIATCKTEALFLYRPIISETYSYCLCDVQTETDTYELKVQTSHTQNLGSSAYTQQWVLYTWDELIMSISQVGKLLHELEEDLSRSCLI